MNASRSIIGRLSRCDDYCEGQIGKLDDAGVDSDRDFIAVAHCLHAFVRSSGLSSVHRMVALALPPEKAVEALDRSAR